MRESKGRPRGRPCPFTVVRSRPPSGDPVEKRVEAADGALVPGMALLAVACRELREELASLEHVRLDIGVFRPVRGASPAVDMDAPSVLQPCDEAAGPALARFADPGRLDVARSSARKPCRAASRRHSTWTK